MTRVLLITTGETPQLVTETVYALLNPVQGECWVPDRIILATTSKGETLFFEGKTERITSLPLVGGDGRLLALYRALGREADHVEPEILVAALPSGEKISDVRSPQEVEAYAQMLLETVLDLTSDDAVELHLSIAGGRKTMSFIAGQIMTMCGRARDVMSHCLIDPSDLENPTRNFWWPGNDGDASTADAKIELHNVPYLKLSHYVDVRKVFRSDRPQYNESVERANIALAAQRLCVDFRDRSITFGKDRLILSSVPFATFVVVIVAKCFDLIVTHASFEIEGSPLRFAYAAGRALCKLGKIDSLKSDMEDVREEFSKGMEYSYTSLNADLSKIKTALGRVFSQRDSSKIYQNMKTAGSWTNFEPDSIDLILPDGFDFSIFEQQNPNFMIGFGD